MSEFLCTFTLIPIFVSIKCQFEFVHQVYLFQKIGESGGGDFWQPLMTVAMAQNLVLDFHHFQTHKTNRISDEMCFFCRSFETYFFCGSFDSSIVVMPFQDASFTDMPITGICCSIRSLVRLLVCFNRIDRLLMITKEEGIT